MGLQPIFKRLHCFQWEQNRKRHRSVDADAWYKWAADAWYKWALRRRVPCQPTLIFVKLQFWTQCRFLVSFVQCKLTLRVYLHELKRIFSLNFATAKPEEQVRFPKKPFDNDIAFTFLFVHREKTLNQFHVERKRMLSTSYSYWMVSKICENFRFHLLLFFLPVGMVINFDVFRILRTRVLLTVTWPWPSHGCSRRSRYFQKFGSQRWFPWNWCGWRRHWLPGELQQQFVWMV